MARRIGRITTYQTVVGPDNMSGVLAYDPSQVGNAVDTARGSITNTDSDYAYPVPDAEFDGGNVTTFARQGMNSRGRGGVGRTPYMMFPMRRESNDGPILYGNQSDGGMTGAPNATLLQIPEHEAFDPAKADGKIAFTPPPKHTTWWGKLIGKTANPKKQEVKQMGRPSVHESMQESEAAIMNQAYVIPNPRQLFDTPAVAGTSLDPTGKPYVAKAGRPVQDNQFMPMEVTVQNIRWKESTNSPPFLPDRVRAGAADPNQSRPSEIPQWLFSRKFDQGMAQNMSGVKGVVRNPLAGRPVATGTEAAADLGGIHTGQYGYRVSTPAPGMSPSGPQPNTMRSVPTPWDSDLYVIDQRGGNRSAIRGRR